MDSSFLRSDAAETTKYLIPIIKKECEKKPSGRLKGYLVPDANLGIVPTQQIREVSCIDKDGNAMSCHGSVKCSAQNPKIYTLACIMIGHLVRENLIKEFENYGFKKFDIVLKCLPEYQYLEDKRIKYRRTGEDILYIKVNIKW